MCEEAPQESSELVEDKEDKEDKAKPVPEKTSDYYCVSKDLPARFNNPAWFRGYRSKEPISIYRTSNQTYGNRAPTVHEMPKVFYPNSNKFSRQLAAGGMFQNNTFNIYMEKSLVTGPDNFITSYDRLNFHPSYNANKPSFCE
ncbi:piercer of microtubule wall 1 protein [Erinaceus europaeus]|uniref:Piercer of microtubule wall 1 protein n=1 Tax=Erinaceus europaeus TaxID=9365 RepID=A0A1S3W981_ERIEU|nr:piercer of microtubule wall 1 protein [Erinaceus europaeus]XP_060055307.1 piercer of microtubule wall 1 protein [Erinaceus europaeus]